MARSGQLSMLSGQLNNSVTLPTKIVCQSNRPAQVKDVRAGRLIWHGTVSWAWAAGLRRVP